MVKIKTNTVKINHLSWKNCTKSILRIVDEFIHKKLIGTIMTKDTIAFYD